MSKSLFLAAIAGVASLAASANATVVSSVGPITFDGATDLSSNFRNVTGSGTIYAPVQVSTNPAGSNYIKTSGVGLCAAPIYDPLNTVGSVAPTLSNTNQFNAPVTVSFGTRVTSAPGSSIGVFFVNPLNENGGSILALINVDNGGSGTTNDYLRIWTGAAVNTSNLGAATNRYAQYVGDLGIAASASPTSAFATLSFTYSIGGNGHAFITVGGPTGSLAAIDTNAAALANSPEVALRMNATTSGEVDVQNFVVSVPEPATMAMAGLLGVALLGARRRIA